MLQMEDRFAKAIFVNFCLARLHRSKPTTTVVARKQERRTSGWSQKDFGSVNISTYSMYVRTTNWSVMDRTFHFLKLRVLFLISRVRIETYPLLFFYAKTYHFLPLTKIWCGLSLERSQRTSVLVPSPALLINCFRERRSSVPSSIQ